MHRFNSYGYHSVESNFVFIPEHYIWYFLTSTLVSIFSSSLSDQKQDLQRLCMRGKDILSFMAGFRSTNCNIEWFKILTGALLQH